MQKMKDFFENVRIFFELIVGILFLLVGVIFYRKTIEETIDDFKNENK